jgi:pimeloyl-ACP methyl ester carboxylesterase
VGESPKCSCARERLARERLALTIAAAVGAAVAPRSRRIALATGLTYQVLEWGASSPSATTFVLVHGFLDLAYGWHGVASLLHGHVIAPDLRGHGDSDWIGDGGYYHYMDYVADLDEVIARLAHERVIVVGHSMGGGVAAYWAASRASRPLGLVLLEGLGPPDQSTIPLAPRTAGWIDAWKAARARRPRAMASLDDAAARLRRNDSLLAPELALTLAAAGTRAVADGVVWKHDPLHTTMGPYPFRVDHAAQFWRSVTCPVLVVDGERSQLNLPDAERAARRAWFPDMRYRTLARAGHMMQRHQPVELAAMLNGFATELSR